MVGMFFGFVFVVCAVVSFGVAFVLLLRSIWRDVG